MTREKFAFPNEDLAAVFGFPFDKNSTRKLKMDRRNERIPVRGEEIGWVQAYEGRMRRFDLEVVLVALSALSDASNLYCALFLP